MNMRKNNTLNLLQAVVTRASKLAAKSSIPKDVVDPSDFVDKSLFEKACEIEMFNVLEMGYGIKFTNNKNIYFNHSE